MRMDAPDRRRWCLTIGGGAIALFLVFRGLDLYGDPKPCNPTRDPGAAAAAEGATRPPEMPPLLRFLNTNKYPASLLFLLMTLGLMIAVIPLLETARGRLARVLMVFGRVPFFYYILRIPLIHLAAIVVSLLREGRVNAWLFANHPMGNPEPPAGYAWGLPLLYLVTLVVVAILYVPCRWMGELKQRRHEAWLRYLWGVGPRGESVARKSPGISGRSAGSELRMASRRRAIGLAALVGFFAITAWSAGFVPSPCCSATCRQCPASLCKATTTEACPKVVTNHGPESADLQPILVRAAAAPTGPGSQVPPLLAQKFRRPMRN